MVRLACIVACLAFISPDRLVSAATDCHDPRSSHLQQRSSDNCTTPANPTVTAPKPNPWNPLSTEEITGLLAWLHDPAQGLNLTVIDKSGPWDNVVGVTELLTPNKTDVLAYLDGSSPAPGRNARVVISYGATTDPYWQEFMVCDFPCIVVWVLSRLLILYKGWADTCGSRSYEYCASQLHLQ
jgi:primary-amine oxidase